MITTKRIRGRDIVARFQPVLTLVENTVHALPRNLQRRLLGFQRLSDGYIARAVRFAALRAVARECGSLVDIRSMTQILAPENLRIGSRVSIHSFTYLDATGGIVIGNDVSIAHSTSIMSTNHTWQDVDIPIRDQPLELAETTIEDGVWIGAGCRILAGIRIGTGAIIAAGAVVTRDVQDNSIVAGVPARTLASRWASEPNGGKSTEV